MHSHNATLYPMLAVGAFMAMFWAGVVAGHALGLGCLSLFVTGLLSACLGTIGVCELERRDRHGMQAKPRRPLSTTEPAAGAFSMRPQERETATAGRRLRSEPC